MTDDRFRRSEDRFRRVLAAGETLFREGDSGNCAYVVEAGTLEVFRERNGQRELLSNLSAGELIGEMALIDRRPRSASVRAVTEVQLRLITREHLDQRLSHTDPLLSVLLKLILKRFRTMMAADTENHPPEPATAVEHAQAMHRLKIEQELALALERNEFVLHYQPIINLDNATTSGFEALLRWQSPSRGFVPPDQFISIAEDSLSIVNIGRWALKEAAAALQRIQGRERRRLSRRPLYVSVNLSGLQLTAESLYDDVMQAVQQADIQTSQLKLEITESLLMENWKDVVSILDRLRAQGIAISVDDFGTGYSSLSYLHRFPVDTLKVDRSFVALMKNDPGSNKILRAVSALAHALNMDIIAEGVESGDQVALLRSMGFDQVQGFLFSKAVTEEKAEELVRVVWNPADGSSRSLDP